MLGPFFYGQKILCSQSFLEKNSIVLYYKKVEIKERGAYYETKIRNYFSGG